MFLAHLIEILFCVLITGHVIRCITYHLRYSNKKARVFSGNSQIPKEVMLALMYGVKTKARFKFKDLSYRKSLAEWKRWLNDKYPSDINLSFQPHSNIVNPKSSEGDLSLECFSKADRKQFPFPKSKTGNNKFISNCKLNKANPAFTKNNLADTVLPNSQITQSTSNLSLINFNNLKNYQNIIPLTKSIFACRL